MDASAAIEKECGALGGLFQTIINEMRVSSPVWEDFTYKAGKLHASLRTSLLAVSAFLDAFQKVADLATSSRGATKEVGSALTRLCMRHRSIESKLKTLTSSVMNGMIIPLQEKLEDWKKVVVQLDRDHSKEYKKAKHEIKKASSDTIRLQKKLKKGKNDMQSKLDNAMHDVDDKYKLLEETEKNALRTALIEERGRFCSFISCIKPFVDNEVALLTEVTHLQDIMHGLCQQASDPHSLPESSEQVITDIKGIDAATFNLRGKKHQHTPPSSPSSLGSRKSSMCSISSINSSSSGSLQSQSPCHSVQAQNIIVPDKIIRDNDDGDTPGDETPTTSNASTPSVKSTWNNWPNHPSQSKIRIDPNRPHTISSAYEKSQYRPALTIDLFEPLPEAMVELRHDPKIGLSHQNSSLTSPYARPCSATINKMQPVLPPLGPKPRPKAVSCPKVPMGPPPIYANTIDLAKLVAERRDELEMMEYPESERGPTPPTPSNDSMQKNSMELAQAIKELEESTAALESSYEATPGFPISNLRTNSLKRNCAPKPPPPVRRSSSVSSGSGAKGDVRISPPRQSGPPIKAPKPPSRVFLSKQNNGKLSHDGPYAELQLIQTSIKHQQEQKHGYQQHQRYQQQLSGHPVSPSSWKEISISPDKSSTESVSSSSNSHYAISAVRGKNVSDTQRMQDMGNPFAAINMQHNVHCNDEIDLPLPPTDDELKEIEKIYSRPPPQLPAASDLEFVKELKCRLIAEDGSDV